MVRIYPDGVSSTQPKRLQISRIAQAGIAANIIEQTLPRRLTLIRSWPRRNPLLGVTRPGRHARKPHNFVPVLRLYNRPHARRLFHLFIRPETPPDLIVIEHLYKLLDPFVRVLAGFTQPDRH